MTIVALVLGLALAAPAFEPPQAAAAVNAEDQDKLTPLMKACAKGDLKIVNDLLEKGADVNYPHAQFRVTPLMFAAYFGHADVVKLLIAKGAKVTARDALAAQAVDWAEFDNHTDVVNILKASGGQTNFLLPISSMPFSVMDKAKGQ